MASVPFARIRCPNPQCGSTRTAVTSKRSATVRYHKCQDCGATFKSIEHGGQADRR